MEAAVWSPSTSGPVSGEIVYLLLTDGGELDTDKGTLKGRIVLPWGGAGEHRTGSTPLLPLHRR